MGPGGVAEDWQAEIRDLTCQVHAALAANRPCRTHVPSQTGALAALPGRLPLRPMSDLTQLLDQARDGDAGALDRVFEALYEELAMMARRACAGVSG